MKELEPQKLLADLAQEDDSDNMSHDLANQSIASMSVAAED